jgi:hypothetical protein
MASKPRPERAIEPPPGFRIDRTVALGRHPIREVFPGIEATETARRHVPDAAERQRLYEETQIELVADDIWMYVAPYSIPKGLRRRWSPIVAPGADCIVVGASHLRESPALIVFLDIFHELCHILQRRAGRELFDRKVSYVRRSTEIEAYQFAIAEARRLGVGNETLREYLRVEWVTEDELEELYRTLGVTGPG